LAQQQQQQLQPVVLAEQLCPRTTLLLLPLGCAMAVQSSCLQRPYLQEAMPCQLHQKSQTLLLMAAVEGSAPLTAHSPEELALETVILGSYWDLS
jgi:hypothetical protein